MTLLEFLRSLIATTGNVARLTELRTPVESVIFDHVFTNRISRATDEISLAEITRVTKARPVISRGGHAIPLDVKNAATTRIEPLSIRLSDFLTGAQLNSLRHLYGTGGENAEALVTAEIDRIVMDLMRTTELTRNALCAQALKGKIDFMMDSNGMTERYVIDFGTTQSLSLTTLLDDESATLVTLMNALRKMKKKITDAGYAGSPVILAGPNAWSTIANLVMATRSEGRKRSGDSMNSTIYVPTRALAARGTGRNATLCSSSESQAFFSRFPAARRSFRWLRPARYTMTLNRQSSATNSRYCGEAMSRATREIGRQSRYTATAGKPITISSTPSQGFFGRNSSTGPGSARSAAR